MNRRSFIKLSGVAALMLSGCGGDFLGVSDFNLVPFTKPLSVPPELNGTLNGTTREYNLAAQDGVSSFFDGFTTPTRGINGALLGPTLRLTNGEDVALIVSNTLNERLSLHWHGMHLPAAMDGNMHQEMAAGGTWTASFTVNQKACTNWYHPHTHELTAQHVYQGMAGFIIIDDTESTNLDLPKSYGVDDFPIVVQDRSFNPDGTLEYNLSRMDRMRGKLGDIILVNGVVNPYVDLPNKEVRFRLLNGSNARVYEFAFSDNKAFKQIATDNSFLPAPVALTSLRLSPGERAEIVVDFTQDSGKEFILQDLKGGFDIFKARINKSASSTTTTPATLTDLSTVIPDATQAVKTRTFNLGMSRMQFTINDKLFDSTRIDEIINVNDIEIWEITNSTDMIHNFHMHATHFYIISRSSGAVAANEKGLKDTVYVAPGETVKVVVQMTDYTDTTNPYMYHCHILEHENAGMMGQFTVV